MLARIPWLLVVTLGLPACRSVADLEPAETAHRIPLLDGAARVDVGNVTLIAETEAWPGDAVVAERVTPLRVTVTNDGDEAVRIRYGDFALVGSSGTIYRALPPLEVGSVDAVDPEAAAAITPGFDHHRFAVARAYGPAYPQVGVYDGDFDHDRRYHSTFYGHWNDAERLPTLDMVAAALPEGVVAPGGYVSGWLYFQKVDEDEVRVRFLADLREPDDGDPVAKLEIPFERD